MDRLGRLISKYLVFAVLPYFVFSWLLLSVILFVQQASRFSDIFFSVNIPANLIWQLTIALVPNVIAFTCPMAILVGTVIGLAKMQTDNELVAIRASGVGNLQIMAPFAIVGVLLSIFAFFVNLEGVPFAAQLVRKVALETAIKKLESPIEPGIFNSEVSGYTIFVRDGDPDSGRWNNIFIYSENASNGTTRLITAKRGRIDVSEQLSELVLEDAVVSTIPTEPGLGKYVSENLGEIRLAIKTRRGQLIERLSNSDGSIEELGLSGLADYASSGEGTDRIEAQILWQRRVILSITPLIFSLLGAAMILRFNRGGRGLGVLLALLTLIGYYLLALLGEQLARSGTIAVSLGSFIPIAASILAIVWFNYSPKIGRFEYLFARFAEVFAQFRAAPNKIQLRNLFVDVTTGIRDFDITFNLVKYFLLSMGFLISVFVIFTAFDLWKFAGALDGGTLLLCKYLFYLMPFIYLQLAPSAAMIGTLATYVIKSRQNEIVTWTSAGQSVYRLLLPCFLATAALGIVNWGLQEYVLPGANQQQDMLRSYIRSRGSLQGEGGKHWVARENRIYKFDLQENGEERSSVPASDNDKQTQPCPEGCVRDLTVFEFTNGTAELQSLYRAETARWKDGRIILSGNIVESRLTEGNFVNKVVNSDDLAGGTNPFVRPRTKPSHLNIAGIKAQIASSESELERRNFEVYLEKKYSTLVLPFVIALFTAPFAFSLSRKAKAGTVGYAIALWLLFTGVSAVFEQLGLNGYLSPSSAVWSPLLIFTIFGVYRITKVRT